LIISFASEYPESTTLIYSAHATFTRVLDDPVGHGFHEANAAREAGKGIWMDHLHPTSKMHDFVAKYLAAFLGTVVSLTAQQLEQWITAISYCSLPEAYHYIL
jgi:phospholipase/lecithinase/hemolysin